MCVKSKLFCDCAFKISVYGLRLFAIYKTDTHCLPQRQRIHQFPQRHIQKEKSRAYITCWYIFRVYRIPFVVCRNNTLIIRYSSSFFFLVVVVAIRNS